MGGISQRVTCIRMYYISILVRFSLHCTTRCMLVVKPHFGWSSPATAGSILIKRSCGGLDTSNRVQRTNFHKHTRLPIAPFAPPERWFSHIHVDLVSPLPPSNGCKYLLICVDHFICWLEAWTLENISTFIFVVMFTMQWISRFRVPDYKGSGTRVRSQTLQVPHIHLWNAAHKDIAVSSLSERHGEEVSQVPQDRNISTGNGTLDVATTNRIVGFT